MARTDTLLCWPARAFAALVCACACATAAAQTLTVGRIDSPSLLADVAERVMREAAKRSGITLALKGYPLARAVEMANEGDSDADLMRIADIGAKYPNLMALATPIAQVDVVIYGVNKDIVDRSRAEIMKMRVGIIRGTFVLVKHTQGMAVIDADYPSSVGGAMLRNGRVDAVAAVYVDTEVELGPNRGEITRWPHLWASEPLYFWLNRKHSALAPRLEAALVQMKAQGVIDSYYRDALLRNGIPPLVADKPPPAR